MRRLAIGFVGFVIVFVTSYGAKAEESPAKITPIQISIWNPVQLAPEDWDVWGVRLNLLYGCNRHVVGLDLGLGNFAFTLKGVQLGLINIAFPYTSAMFAAAAHNHSEGIQLGLCNDSYRMKGIQIGFGNGCSGDSAGFQYSGGFNGAESFTGLQASGLWNEAGGCRGVQMALVFNRSEDMKGVQVGLVNYCEAMTGVQIGLVNIIRESPVAFFPVVNAHF